MPAGTRSFGRSKSTKPECTMTDRQIVQIAKNIKSRRSESAKRGATKNAWVQALKSGHKMATSKGQEMPMWTRMTKQGTRYAGGLSRAEEGLQDIMAKSVGNSTALTKKSDYKSLPLSAYLPGVVIRSSKGRKKKARNASQLGDNVPIGTLRKKKAKTSKKSKKKSKKSSKTVIQRKALNPHSRKIYEHSRGRQKKEKSKYVHTFYDKDQRKPVSTDHALHGPTLNTKHRKKKLTRVKKGGKKQHYIGGVRLRNPTTAGKALAHESKMRAAAWHDFHKPIKGEKDLIKLMKKNKKSRKERMKARE